MKAAYDAAFSRYIARHEDNAEAMCRFTLDDFRGLAERGVDPRLIPCFPCNVVCNYFLQGVDADAQRRPLMWGRRPFGLGFTDYAVFYLRRQFNASILATGTPDGCMHYSPKGGGPHAGAPRLIDTLTAVHLVRAHARHHRGMLLQILTDKAAVVPERPMTKNVVMMMEYPFLEVSLAALASGNKGATYRDNFMGARMRLHVRREESESAIRERRRRGGGRQKDKSVDRTTRMNTGLMFANTALLLGARKEDEVVDVATIMATHAAVFSSDVHQDPTVSSRPSANPVGGDD